MSRGEPSRRREIRRGVLVGIGGLNVDPYANEPRTGRLRQPLLCARRFAGRGIGSALVRHLLAATRGSFDTVRLRTADAASGRFYEALGFVATADRFATHERTMDSRS